MPATFAAYVPVCPSCFHGYHSSRAGTPDPNPASQPTQQDITAAGIITAICLAGFVFLALTARR
jgi:hypothetical protein